MAYKIGVIGDTASILAFMAVGFSVFPTENPEEAGKLLLRLAKENYAILYLTEDLAKEIPDTIARFKDVPVPAVIVIPGNKGSSGYGMDNIRRSVERAVGADIL